MDVLSALQWPAMAASVVAAWLVASSQEGRRNSGFWIFLLGNVLWTIWGAHTRSWALIALQICLAVLNIRGAQKSAGPEARSLRDEQPLAERG